MYPAKPGLVIGFHGCDLALRNKLVNGTSSLKPSRNKYDWLGNGIYFWENNHYRALSFAKELKARQGQKSKIVTPAVVGAVIDMGFCLDLLDEEFIKLVRGSFKTLSDAFKIAGFAVPTNKNVSNSNDLLLRNLDCAVIENLHRVKANVKPFDSVRCAFIEGQPLYANAGFHSKNHIQICIRNPNCIKGYFIPLRSKNSYPVP